MSERKKILLCTVQPVTNFSSHLLTIIQFSLVVPSLLEKVAGPERFEPN